MTEVLFHHLRRRPVVRKGGRLLNDLVAEHYEREDANDMTKLLERAIAKIRELPDEDQDALALQLLALADAGVSDVELDGETRAAIREGLEQAQRGEFVSDDEIAALWKRHGL